MIAWRTDVKWRQWHFAFLFHNQQIDSMLPSDHHAKASKCGKDISNRLMWLFRSCHILTSSMPDQLLNRRPATWNLFVKAAKYEIQKPSTCRAALFRCRFWVDALRLLHCVINLSRNGYICRGLEKIVAISRARVYFEQQILALVFVFHQTRNLSWIHSKQINQSVRCISSTSNNCFCCATSWSRKVKNEKHRPKTCNGTMFRGKLRAFEPRISPPLKWAEPTKGKNTWRAK